MNLPKHGFLTHALAAVSTLALITAELNATGFITYGQNSRSFENTDRVIHISKDLGKNIYAIDNLADQMLFRFNAELKTGIQSESAEALLKQLKIHAGLTNDLINAYRGKGSVSYAQAAITVERSIKTLIVLRKDVKISDSLSLMIIQSLPLISYVTHHATHSE